jgi:hypothetical protein
MPQQIQAAGSIGVHARLRCQAGAPFGAAAADNRPAGSRAHARTEAVGALVADFTRLICSFHFYFSSTKLDQISYRVKGASSSVLE